MPVELEYKYVLDSRHQELIETLNSMTTANHIEQIYVDKGNRFRHIRKVSQGKTADTYLHTFKKKLGGKVLEIENEVSESDYRMVKDNMGVHEFPSISKVRYKLKDGTTTWDIDFLLTRPLIEFGSVYFALAEAEIPDGATHDMLPLLEPYVRLAVPLEHSNWFSNFKLSNSNYAETAVEEYTKWVASSGS